MWIEINESLYNTDQLLSIRSKDAIDANVEELIPSRLIYIFNDDIRELEFFDSENELKQKFYELKKLLIGNKITTP